MTVTAALEYSGTSTATVAPRITPNPTEIGASSGLRIGMVGPISPPDLADLLDSGANAGLLPLGLGGTPVTMLVRELVSRKIKVVVFSLDPTISDEVVLEGPLLRICLGPYRPRARARMLDFFAAERRYLHQAILRERPDVLHAQWTYEFALPALRTAIPTVVTAHDAPFSILRYDRSPYRMVRTLMAIQALRKIRHLATVSPYVVEHLRDWHLYRRPVAVIPNGLPASQFERPAGLRQAAEGLVFASILNGWTERKNGEGVVAAFALVRKQLPRARLLAFGKGFEADGPAFRWAAARSMTEAVSFLGERPYPEILDRLRREVDVFVHPAREESHGMVLIEAMAAGVPVIGGRKAGAVPWTLEHGAAGILVDVEQPPAIAAGMLDLANSAEARSRWGAKGYESVWRRFRIAVVADAYLDLYRRVVGEA